MAENEQLESIRQQLNALRESKVLDGDGADRSENLHRLFIYPAMMVPAAQHAIINSVSNCLPKGAWAIDPFMGSGTSLMSCLEFGFRVFGQDINPFAVLLSKAKVERYDIKELKDVCHVLMNQIESDGSEEIEVSFNNVNKWFNHDTQVYLSKIRRAIISVDSIAIRRFLWIIMSEVIRTGSNDRTSTFKLHRRSEDDIKKRRVNIIKEFSSLVARGIEDIEDYWNKIERECSEVRYLESNSTNISWGNTQEQIQSTTKFDLLVSSPPYGDNHTTVTYGQTSYLPLQWIDQKDLDCPYDYVKTTQEIDRRSLGGRLRIKEIAAKRDRIAAKSPSLRSFLDGIPYNEQKKYNKTVVFISDFDESLDKIISVMKENAFYIWTIGNRYVGGREVPNDRILQDLMESRGITLFERAERQILNKKQARKNNYSNTMEKEHILIFHKSE